MTHRHANRGRLRDEFGFQEIPCRSADGRLGLLFARRLGLADFVCWMPGDGDFRIMRYGALHGAEADWHDMAGRPFADAEQAIHAARLLFEHETLPVLPAPPPIVQT